MAVVLPKREPTAPLELLEPTLVPLPLIREGAASPRAELPDIAALAENIRQLGLLQPVSLRRVSGGYELLSGHRRLAAYRLLHERFPMDGQWAAIPAVAGRMDDATATLSLLSAQVMIEPWSTVEEAAVLAHLQRLGMGATEIGQVLHKTTSWASKRARVHTDQVLAPLVRTGQLSTGVAEVLLTVRPRAARSRLAGLAAAEHWTQSRARTEARQAAARQSKGGHRTNRGRIDRSCARRVSVAVRKLLSGLTDVDAKSLPADTLELLAQLHGRIDELLVPRPQVLQERAA